MKINLGEKLIFSPELNDLGLGDPVVVAKFLSTHAKLWEIREAFIDLGHCPTCWQMMDKDRRYGRVCWGCDFND